MGCFRGGKGYGKLNTAHSASVLIAPVSAGCSLTAIDDCCWEDGREARGAKKEGVNSERFPCTVEHMVRKVMQ